MADYIMTSIKDVLTTTLENLLEEDFMRFKNKVRDMCEIPLSKLEKADHYVTIDHIVEKFTEEKAGEWVAKILEKMDKNEMAKNLREKLNLDCTASQHSKDHYSTERKGCPPSQQQGQGEQERENGLKGSKGSVGNYGDVMKIKTTGASAATACQDGDREISGIDASFQLAKTDLQRMNRHKDAIINVGRETGVDPAVIAAVISRASRAGSEYVLVNGWSASGAEFGLMQIAKQWHNPKGAWDSEEHIKQGTNILIYSIAIIQNKFPDWTKEQQLKGGLAAYNAGPGNVHQYDSVDENTSAKDYSNDVVARAQYYREHGFTL